MINHIPNNMEAVLLTGHGGLEKLEYCHDVVVPKPLATEFLIRVAAAGINSDINTRTVWHSKSVTTDINVGGKAGFESVDDSEGSWSGVPFVFPRIRGADCCEVFPPKARTRVKAQSVKE
ncbi:MAG: hypothetical protein ACI9V8_000359 [Urechidicola sp.]|jgi:hypothetical protein